MKFAWAVKQLNVIPTKDQHSDVVHSVAWEVTGSDGKDSTSTSGALSINTDVTENFTAYENLTEAQVLSWVFAALGQDGKQRAEDQVQLVLESKRSIVAIVPKSSLPWSI